MTAQLHRRIYEIHSRDADEYVDDTRKSAHVTKDGRDEVEVKGANEEPVQSANDHKHQSHPIDCIKFHFSLLMYLCEAAHRKCDDVVNHLLALTALRYVWVIL